MGFDPLIQTNVNLDEISIRISILFFVSGMQPKNLHARK